MWHPSLLEWTFLVSSAIGVIIAVASVDLTRRKRAAIKRAGIDGVEEYYARLRARQEIVRLLVQVLFLTASLIAAYLPNPPPIHDQFGLERDGIIACLVAIEWLIVGQSILDLRARHGFLTALERERRQARARAEKELRRD